MTTTDPVFFELAVDRWIERHEADVVRGPRKVTAPCVGLFYCDLSVVCAACSLSGSHSATNGEIAAGMIESLSIAPFAEVAPNSMECHTVPSLNRLRSPRWPRSRGPRQPCPAR